MATRIPTAAQDAACDGVVDLVDVGAGTSGLLRIYSGTQPASANSAASGILLAEVELEKPAFTASSSGVATLLGTPLSTTGAAAGTAGWFRIVNADGDTVLDGACGLSGSGAELILNTLTISIGVNVEITSGTVTMPAT
jgi:hypothetical protein